MTDRGREKRRNEMIWLKLVQKRPSPTNFRALNQFDVTRLFPSTRVCVHSTSYNGSNVNQSDTNVFVQKDSGKITCSQFDKPYRRALFFATCGKREEEKKEKSLWSTSSSRRQPTLEYTMTRKYVLFSDSSYSSHVDFFRPYFSTSSCCSCCWCSILSLSSAVRNCAFKVRFRATGMHILHTCIDVSAIWQQNQCVSACIQNAS